MAMALRLAAKGRGLTSPNPMVGALVVAGTKVLGAGWHHRAGSPHAEVIALQRAGHRARGATLYVTLEPCSHTNKRTPPCVPSILASGVRRVVVAMPDPNPLVSGRGLRRLRARGMTVAVGCLREEAEQLNESYGHWVTTERPFVLLKAGMTLDGKIATSGGDSQWITSDAARRDVHRLRSCMDAVMVGIGTVLKDDPWLTARRSTKHGQRLYPRQPLRMIMDSRLRTPLTARVLARTGNARGRETHERGPRALIATTSLAPTKRVQRLRSLGIPVLILPKQQGRVSLPACLARLGQMGVTSLMIEGGSELNASALRAGVVNRLRLYIAPKLLGGQDAKSVIGGVSPQRVKDSLPVEALRVHRIGPDLVIDAALDHHLRPGSPGKRKRSARS